MCKICSSSSSSSSSIYRLVIPCVCVMPPGTSSQTVNHRRRKKCSSKINKKTFFIHFAGIKKQFNFLALYLIVCLSPSSALHPPSIPCRRTISRECAKLVNEQCECNRINVNWCARNSGISLFPGNCFGCARLLKTMAKSMMNLLCATARRHVALRRMGRRVNDELIVRLLCFALNFSFVSRMYGPSASKEKYK